MMAKQVELNNRISKGFSQREIRPVWNNVQRMNHQTQFVPTAVLTRTGKIPVNTAKTSDTNTVNTVRHNFNSQAVQINVDRKVNTVKPIVNNAKPKAGFHKSVSPFRKSFNRTTALRTNFLKQKVNTAEVYLQEIFQNDHKLVFACQKEATQKPPVLSAKQEDQVFLDELERLKRQEKDANDAAEALRKEFAQDTEDLLLQAGAAKASRRTAAIQDSKSLDSCRFALWEEGNWNKIDSDYAGANLDRKSTTGEYVAAVNCCGQVLWIQNQMLDYGFNFMNTKIYNDNESTICIVKNPIFYSKTKHIAIRHHFIRDAYEKKLIQMLKIHTDDNVADLLTRHLMLAGSSSGCILLGSDQPKAALVFLDKQLKNVHVPLDHFPINALTSKVFSFMVKKGKHFSGKVTPLFPNMLVQPTEDEGEGSERPSEPQPIPSPPHPSTDQHETQTNPSPRPSPTSHITDSIPEGSGGNHGGQSSSDKSLSGNEGGMTLQSV
ncbi:hypothetical protein Tco_1547634 [Tanacetum coccineum]